MHDRELAEAICALTCELRDAREQRKIESDFFRSMFGLATKKDLKEMERRLTDAIEKSASITPAIDAAALRLGITIDNLDATIPDKQTETKV